MTGEAAILPDDGAVLALRCSIVAVMSVVVVVDGAGVAGVPRLVLRVRVVVVVGLDDQV